MRAKRLARAALGLGLLGAATIGPGWSPAPGRGGFPGMSACADKPPPARREVVRLPPPRTGERGSVEAAIAARRSVREWSAAPLTVGQLGQILWAAQGVTSAEGLRSAPSAGALYPLELYVAVARVEGLNPGVYHYLPGGHALQGVSTGDVGSCLVRAAGGQEMVGLAPAALVFAAVHARTAARYGDRARRYVAMEVGAAAENVYLQAQALGLGTVAVGAIDEGVTRRCIAFREGEEPLLFMPVGRREPTSE